MASLRVLAVFFRSSVVVRCSLFDIDSLLVCSSTITIVRMLQARVVSSSGSGHSSLFGTDLFSYISVMMDIGTLVRLSIK